MSGRTHGDRGVSDPRTGFVRGLAKKFVGRRAPAASTGPQGPRLHRRSIRPALASKIKTKENLDESLLLSLTIAAFALPAFAQSGDTQATGTGQQDQVMAMTAEKLKTQLSNAGFKEVTVLDAAYLVQAQTEDGNRVLMLINPPANMTDTTATTGSTAPESDASTEQQ